MFMLIEIIKIWDRYNSCIDRSDERVILRRQAIEQGRNEVRVSNWISSCRQVVYDGLDIKDIL